MIKDQGHGKKFQDASKFSLTQESNCAKKTWRGEGEGGGGFLNSVLVMKITIASNHKPKKEESDIVTVVIKNNSIPSLHLQIDAMLSQI